MKHLKLYTQPTCEVITLDVERGFSESGGLTTGSGIESGEVDEELQLGGWN
ncbi:MAG: hypothetical protein IJ014_05495 [Rikenellaceae bacterium]|nr:hypothetical protein [Rikenellaceae bacterium]